MSGSSFNVICLDLLRLFGRIYWRNGCRQNKIKRLGQSIQTTHKTTRASKIKSWGILRICGRGSFKIIPFLQMQSNDTNLRRVNETKFQRKYKTKLNQLWETKGVTQTFNALMKAFKNTLNRDHHFLVRFYTETQRKCPCLMP